jgi:predicted HTH domain antitoxin
MNSQLTLELPSDVLQTLRAHGLGHEELSHKARGSLAVMLYREHLLSLGKAAELADMPLVKFMDLLADCGVAVTTYGEEEYAQDSETIQHLTSTL